MDFHDEHTVEHEPVHTSDATKSSVPRNKLLRFFSARRAHLITDAKRSPEQNLQHREHMYKWLQGSRVPFLLASGVAYMWMHSIVLSVILFLISIPLPWIAVVVANGVGEPKDPRSPAVYKPALNRQLMEYQQLGGAQRAGLAPPQQQDPQAFKGQVIDHDATDDHGE